MHFKDLLIWILCFFIIHKAEAFSSNSNLIDDHISINCGSSAASSVALTGRQWVGDKHPNFTIKGYSSTSSTISADHPVPYNTARISRSQFSYSFRLNPGQKFIRFLFSPTSYRGFKRFNDLFTVEAGPFTLLANFSASLTADALAVTTFAKEFCVSIRENQPFDIVFSPATQHNAYAFINGIEIISVSSSIDYCYGSGDAGIQVVGHKSAIYIDDNITALEMVHRQNFKRDFVPSADDIHAMLGMWARIFNKRSTNHASNLTWRLSVDVGFKYLIRLHFCETGLKMAETGFMDFVLVINHVIATTSAEILQEREAQGTLWYKSYVVTVNGHKREGKRDILISLHSKDEFLDGHGPLEGYEIFKLSNPDNNLASPTALFIHRDSPSHAIQIILSVLGLKNVIATVIIAMISLVSIIVHVLQKNWGYGFNEEENKPSTRARQLCRRFSLAEIQSATDDFNDAYVIGRGGFGKVYKGRIDNGKRETVAIKRLKPNSKQGTREFWTEIETLSELRHVNLISLIGYCNEQWEMVLVYEYMPCGNLADHLYKLAIKYDASSSLSWKERLEICIGAGRGIDYLHTHRFIHRDIKGSNILLDENFVAKVSDFGLAKIESGNELESQGSTNLKGTFGYIDPDFFKTHRITTKSDTYSFGVVLLEVLCGRPAVEPWAEEGKRSLTAWALDNISKGDVDQIVDPSLRGEILHNSLMRFVRITERCLHDEPKRRPAMAHVVINLEFALEQQANANFLVANEITSVADFFLSSGKVQQGNTNSLVPNKLLNAGDALPCTDRTLVSVSTRQLTVASSIMKNGTSPLTEQINSKTITSGTKDGIKTTMHKLSRRLWPWDAFRKTQKSSMKRGFVSMPLSAPVSCRINNITSRASTLPEKRLRGSNIQMISPDLRIFSFSELKIATGNFRSDTVVGRGGFGIVYNGWLRDKHNAKKGSGNVIAVKKLNSESSQLNSESSQGIAEWQSEVNFLGSLSHPNLVKLLGSCNWKNKEHLLVYEFMQKGSLEDNLFRRGTCVQPLSWDIRLNILIGAARGLAFLHASDKKVIHRDIKPSNILLDESYHARLGNFGLARCAPTDGSSYVSTMVAGTFGYIEPEYFKTGHFYVKSDVYSFGVVLVVTLTGLKAIDPNRPSEQHVLAVWIRAQLPEMTKLKMFMDSSLKGRYPALSALKVLELAQNCLQLEPKNRPSMKQVVETLEAIQDLAVEKPRQPRVQFHDHPAAA